MVSCVFASALATFCSYAVAQPASPKDFTSYRDAENRYSISYPKNWTVEPTTYERTRIKVVSPNGMGDCLVNVQPTDGKLSDQAALKQLFDDAPNLETKTQTRIPGTKILTIEKTTISDQRALKVLLAIPRTTLGEGAVFYSLSFQTFRSGSAFTVGCRTDQVHLTYGRGGASASTISDGLMITLFEGYYELV